MPIINDSFENVCKTLDDASIDLILTDPPYEIGYSDGINPAPLKKLVGDIKGGVNWTKLMSEAKRLLKPKKMIYLHCRVEMVPRIFAAAESAKLKFCHDFVWMKGDMGYGNLGIMGTTHELILGFSNGTAEKARPMSVRGELKKRVAAVFCGKLSTKENYGHPTQKPIELLSYIILNRTDKDDVIFDPFSGSGSTGVAAKILGRSYIGAEVDKHFYDLSLKRLSDEAHLNQYQHIATEVLIPNIYGFKFQRPDV